MSLLNETNISVSDYSLQSISSSFELLGNSIELFFDGMFTFFTSLGYWAILCVVVIGALCIAYLFFWVYYKSALVLISAAPRLEQAIGWLDRNILGRLEDMADGRDEDYGSDEGQRYAYEGPGGERHGPRRPRDEDRR